MNIPHVKLLKGSHVETGQTGQGCFMNVIAYLNNEPTITDKSNCVCFVIRPLAIWANDWMTDEERPQLLPFILRALGSSSTDKAEVSRRLALVVGFGNEMAAFSKNVKHTEYLARHAALYSKSDGYTEFFAKYAALLANNAAFLTKSPAEYTVIRKQIIASLLALFDAALPPLQDVGEQTMQFVRELESFNE